MDHQAHGLGAWIRRIRLKASGYKHPRDIVLNASIMMLEVVLLSHLTRAMIRNPSLGRDR